MFCESMLIFCKSQHAENHRFHVYFLRKSSCLVYGQNQHRPHENIDFYRFTEKSTYVDFYGKSTIILIFFNIPASGGGRTGHFTQHFTGHFTGRTGTLALYGALGALFAALWVLCGALRALSGARYGHFTGRFTGILRSAWALYGALGAFYSALGALFGALWAFHGALTGRFTGIFRSALGTLRCAQGTLRGACFVNRCKLIEL